MRVLNTPSIEEMLSVISPIVKARRKAYCQRPEVKARRKAYCQRPEKGVRNVITKKE